MSSSFRRRAAFNATDKIHVNQSVVSDEGPSIPTIVQRKGTKAWTGGNALTSSGLRDFDSILGGGQPIGTLILLEEDRWTQDMAMTLMRYWSAEAVAQQHRLLLATTAHNSTWNTIHQGFTPCDASVFFRTLLPRNLTWDKSSELQSRRVVDSSPLPTCLEDNVEQIDLEDFDESAVTLSCEDENDTSTDHLLINAWQYKVSVQKERSGQSQSYLSRPSGLEIMTNVHQISDMRYPTDSYCHSYDLSGNLAQQCSPDTIQQLEEMGIVRCCDAYNSTAPAFSLFQTWIHAILHQVQQHPSSVVRFLLPNIPMVSATACALSLTIAYIRNESLPVVILATLRSWLDHEPPTLHALRRTCDAVFSCQGFASLVAPPPPEFHDLQGIFYIRKISSLFPSTTQFNASTSSHSRRPLTHRMGIKRDRRRLTLQMLHLPPEDYSSGTGMSVRTSGMKQDKDRPVNNKSMACSRNHSSKGTNPLAVSLDF